MKFLLLLSSLFLATNAFANRESGGRRSANAVYLNFTSIGTGIDYRSLSVARNYINNASSQGLVVESFSEQRGREGEVFMCVRFTNPQIREDFFKSISPFILADRNEVRPFRTSVRVGLDCSNYDGATEQKL